MAVATPFSLEKKQHVPTPEKPATYPASQPASLTGGFQNQDQTRQSCWRFPPARNLPLVVAVSKPRGRCTANSPLAMAVC